MKTADTWWLLINSEKISKNTEFGLLTKKLLRRHKARSSDSLLIKFRSHDMVSLKYYGARFGMREVVGWLTTIRFSAGLFYLFRGSAQANLT